MKKIFTLTLVFLLLSPLTVHAADNGYGKNFKTEIKLKDSRGSIVGKVTATRQDNLLYTDYDFDCPSDCRLRSITTYQNSRQWTHKVEDSDGQTLHDYPNTYIAPRDAVLAFDVSNQDYWRSRSFNSRVVFDCKDRTLTAYTHSYILHDNLTPTPTATPTQKPCKRNKYCYQPNKNTNNNESNLMSGWTKGARDHYYWFQNMIRGN